MVEGVSVIRRWDSLGAYIRDVQNTDLTKCRRPQHEALGGEWDLGISGRDAQRMCLEGDPSLLSRATSAIDKLTDRAIQESPRSAWQNAHAGTRVNVPRYLGGSPDSMMRRVRVPQASRHVSIYVGLTSYCGVRASDLLTRGCTILALLEALVSCQVGVDLYLLVESDGVTDGSFYQTIKVDSSPLDLSSAGFAIAHPAFPRNVAYRMAEVLAGFSGGFADGAGRGRTDYEGKLRERLSLNPEDIYLPSPESSDPVISTPDVWLATQLDKINERSAS